MQIDNQWPCWRWIWFGVSSNFSILWSFRSILSSSLSKRMLTFLMLSLMYCIPVQISVNISIRLGIAGWGWPPSTSCASNSSSSSCACEVYQVAIRHWPIIYLILSYFFSQSNYSSLALLVAHSTSRSHTPARSSWSNLHMGEASCYPDIWLCVAWCNEAN